MESKQRPTGVGRLINPVAHFPFFSQSPLGRSSVWGKNMDGGEVRALCGYFDVGKKQTSPFATVGVVAAAASSSWATVMWCDYAKHGAA